jgi:hypothetical protein
MWFCAWTAWTVSLWSTTCCGNIGWQLFGNRFGGRRCAIALVGFKLRGDDWCSASSELQ